MPLLVWRKEFELGIPSVDYEHKELVNLINELHGSLSKEGPKDAISEFLGEIYARISAHFALEEKIMRERRYDQYQDHKADHERLLDEIRDIMDEFERDAYFDYEEALSARLKEWWTRHSKDKDARLHRMLGPESPWA